MNLLHLNNGEFLPKVKVNEDDFKEHIDISHTYTFGDLLNIWSKEDDEANIDVFNRWFIRDDHYFSNVYYFVHMSNVKYDRHLIQTYSTPNETYFNDEVFIPTFEDMFEHEWYELNLNIEQ